MLSGACDGSSVVLWGIGCDWLSATVEDCCTIACLLHAVCAVLTAWPCSELMLYVCVCCPAG